MVQHVREGGCTLDLSPKHSGVAFRVHVYIDPKRTISRVPTIAVRGFLRRAGDYNWSLEYVCRCLHLSAAHAKRFVSTLLRLGYVEPAKGTGKTRCYTLTLAGRAFAKASAARPLRLATARRKLDEFLNCVRAVNESEYFLYKVKRVLVFGSYLQNKERLNDVDLAVELVHREADPKIREAVNQERVKQARQGGRNLDSISELFWPYEEVMLFLKARSRAISLHTTDDPILRKVKSRVIFRASRPFRAGHTLSSYLGFPAKAPVNAGT